MISDSLLSTSFRLATQTIFQLKMGRPVQLPPPIAGHRYMLYAHVPFCESLCPYCSFNRFIFQEGQARSYFAGLREEMRQVARKGYQFESMYVGGGTPTILIDELAETIDLARELFQIDEVSCETNPTHLTPEVADVLGKRVQRLSVGVQSFDDELLKKVNRFDRFGSGQETLHRIQQIAGRFDSLNVDMIFNFPGQDEEAVRRDVAMVIESGANQATFYPLMTSPTVTRALEHSVGKVEHTHEEQLYDLIVSEMSGTYDLATAWTFSKHGGGLIDEYIIDNEEYLGVGSGSFSYLDGAIYVNTFSLDAYRTAIATHRPAATGMHRFNPLEQMRYRFMMDLFGLALDKKDFQQRFKLPVELALPMEMAFFASVGAFAENNAERITLTARGRYLLVVMMREFFSGINRIRDQARKTARAKDSAGSRVLSGSQGKA
jgi:coproporphyrinogen III oxidase-like Fe-S oxidoreductase